MEKLIIRNLNPLQRVFFNASVNYTSSPPKTASDWHKTHAGTTVHITQDFEVYAAKEQKDSKPAWAIRFDENRTSFFIEWDETSSSPMDKAKSIAAKHLMFHEKIQPLFAQVNTNKRGEAIFSIEYEGMKNTFIADLNDKKFDVYAKFRAFTPEEKRDCAFHYNVNATNMRHSEIIAKMIDMEKGVLMNPNAFTDGMCIMDHFLEKYGNNEIVNVKMLCEKSITQGLIQQRDNGYYLDKDYIGTTKEMVYDYIKTNAQVHDMLKQQSGNLDKKVEDDLTADKKVKHEELKPLKNLDRLNELIPEALALGIRRAKNMGEKTLIDAIAEKKEINRLSEEIEQLTGAYPGDGHNVPYLNNLLKQAKNKVKETA